MRAMAVVDSVAFPVGLAHDGLPGAEVGPAQHWHYISLLFVSTTIMMMIILMCYINANQPDPLQDFLAATN